MRKISSSEYRNAAVSMLLGLSMFTAAGIAQQKQALKDAFKGSFLIGAAVNSATFTGKDEQAATLIKAQFNTISPENALKWEKVHPQLNQYDFAAADQYVAFGEKNNMAIIGHTLVWHNQTPKWVFQDADGKDLSKEKLLERMRDHLTTVVGRYKGRIKGWDVVNEAVLDDGSFIQSKWFKIIGEEYIAKAFQYAHEADPQAELYYNDFSMENVPKRAGAIAMVKKLQSQGIKVSGVGLQGHYHLNWPRVSQLDSTITEFAQLGVTVVITELDVDVLPQPDWTATAEITTRFQYLEKMDPYKNGLPDSVQLVLANRYAELFGVFIKNRRALTRVTFWGVTDGSSWLNGFPIPGRTNHPLLFDRIGNAKPAFEAVIKTAGNR
jgi:endo-1,4-beta-xylanase